MALKKVEKTRQKEYLPMFLQFWSSSWFVIFDFG
jgi:hypothetical protein